MQLTEDQAAEVKTWVVKKLEDISDADSDVLADYVLALIRSDAPDEEIRKASVENLEDFLREHTTEFVEELFATFAPKQTPAAPAQVQIPQAPTQPSTQAIPPTGPLNGSYGPQSHGDNFSRKRTFDDGFGENQGHEGAPHHRNFKNPRRGRGGSWMGASGQFPPPRGGFPVMSPSFPGFDQNDPMAAMMALQSMGFPQMPGMPPMPMPPGSGPPGQQPEQMGPKSTEKCPFYETQGICYLGGACPYQHDTVPGASKDDEYDPKSSGIVSDFRRRHDGPMRGNDRGRGRGRGGDRGGFNNRSRRSEFSAAGPNDDTSIKTIVVEQIPDDKLDEFSVKEFFSQYGEITELSLQPYKKLALITYADHATAKAAWSSPKVIFDNRFVKVYWHKPKERPGANGVDSQPFDAEEFQKQQEEAQKAYEEKARQRQETEKAKQDLEKQREELLKKQEEEKKRLLQKIGGAASSGSATPTGEASQSPSDENASEQTKQLRAQLAALEAEAKSLGLDPNHSSDQSTSYRGRGRGYGRGGYPPRGRGYDPSYRGSYRGRGGFPARGRGGVLRLDNRPKRVAVSGIKPNSEQDEAFRQHLIGIGEYESVTPNPTEENSLIVAFKERYQAEKFMFSARNIPSVGEVQLSWVPNPPISIPPSAPGQQGVGTPGLDGKVGSDEDTIMDSVSDQDQVRGGNQANGAAAGPAAGAAEMDYDVAEDDDTWGA
ncbi:hypothetical protein BDW74DRAFT_144173 [Aspergillus multicolor]|uniref:CCCH zinc finger and RRM domain protein n=1 Tax=Aspergillus multicolor TaxID=41759 RepID=UPI003CCDBB47